MISYKSLIGLSEWMYDLVKDVAIVYIEADSFKRCVNKIWCDRDVVFRPAFVFYEPLLNIDFFELIFPDELNSTLRQLNGQYQ